MSGILFGGIEDMAFVHRFRVVSMWLSSLTSPLASWNILLNLCSTYRVDGWIAIASDLIGRTRVDPAKQGGAPTTKSDLTLLARLPSTTGDWPSADDMRWMANMIAISSVL